MGGLQLRDLDVKYALSANAGIKLAVADQVVEVGVGQTDIARILQARSGPLLARAQAVRARQRGGDIASLCIMGTGGPTNAMHGGVVELAVNTANGAGR